VTSPVCETDATPALPLLHVTARSSAAPEAERGVALN
jgi:hypothetical protein